MTTPSSFRWLMTAPGAPLERSEFELPTPAPDEVIVRVVGCGLCHTDLGFLFGGVRTNHELPVTLGHEIAGTVQAVGSDCALWAGKDVVIPAVLPCGDCELCNAGKETSCRNQKMPGNDFHGGFASHIVVPAQWLVDAGDLPAGIELADVAVLADAVTTPYQAMVRADVQPGDGVVLIGAGGIGSFGVQIAKAFGARVVAIDIDDEKLGRAAEHGADGIVNTRGMEIKDARKAVKLACKEAGLPSFGTKVLEMSGTPQGQELAWALMTFSGVVGIVGFCLDRVPVRLSNLMAFDATAFGNWGCRPQLYKPALDLIREGKVKVKPFVRHFPMSEINAVLDAAQAHKIPERPVLIP